MPDSDLIGELVADTTQKTPAGRPLFASTSGLLTGSRNRKSKVHARAANRVTERGSQHLVKPGEFLLGYMAGDGTVNHGIPIDARFDSYALLPLQTPAPDRTS